MFGLTLQIDQEMMEPDKYFPGGPKPPFFHFLLFCLLILFRSLSPLSLSILLSFLPHPIWISFFFSLTFLVVPWKRLYERTCQECPHVRMSD